MPPTTSGAGGAREAEHGPGPGPPRDGRLRVRLAVLALVALALAWNARLLVTTLAAHVRPRGPDAVERYVVRFHELRRALPAHGVVGYVSGRPGAVQEFYLTQHVLAPVVVEHTAARPLVIGNFFDPTRAAAIGAREGLAVARDFGHGLILFRRPG